MVDAGACGGGCGGGGGDLLGHVVILQPLDARLVGEDRRDLRRRGQSWRRPRRDRPEGGAGERAACRAGLVQGAPWGRGNLLGEHGEGEEAEEDRLEEEQRHQQKVARVDVRAAAEAACGRERGRRAGRAVFDWDWCVRGAPIWPLTGLLVGAVPTVRRPSSTRAYPLSRPVYPTNSTKCFWLLAPTQLLTHGQWWSIFMMQRSHWEQWWARGGLKPLHLLHIGIDPPFSSCRRWLGE